MRLTKLKVEAMWFIHNMFAHPVSEIFYWMGFIFPYMRVIGNFIHDFTIPKHEKGEGRG